MEKDKNAKWSVLIFFLTGIITAAAGYFYGKGYIEILRNVIIALLGIGMLLYLMENDRIAEKLGYDNGKHKGRFFLLFIFALTCAVVFPLIPASGWPYLAIFVVLALLSNSFIGVVSGSLLLLLTLLHGNGTGAVDFFLYFVAGTAGVVLFRQLDESYKVGARVFLSLLVLLLALSAGYVLPANSLFSMQLFLIPVINLFMSLLLMMVALKYFSYAVIHKYRERYMDLNDQECPLLAGLREKNKEEYFHAIHTAYLCSRAAREVGFNDALMKAGGYYHRIGLLKGENTWENIGEISNEYCFPPELHHLLEEYVSGKGPLVSKEAVVLKLADSVISIVSGMFKKDANVTLNYSLLLDNIFRKRIESGMFNESIISLQEINRIKKVFLEEKLYYDFLR